MEKITIITRMYNPGSFVYQCVDSVLNQTFKNFKYVIIDNASSDGTKEVLEEYAKKDSRIRLYRNECNNVSVLECFQTYADTEYFMNLDHDDWLEVDALEKLLGFAEESGSDMVVGRTNMVTETGEFMETRGLAETVTLSSFGLGNNLRHVYWQLRTTWAAVIKSSLIKNIDVNVLKKIWTARYGGDTVKTFSMAFSANQISFLNEVVHNYRVVSTSDSHTFHRTRFLADWLLFDFVKGLLEKQGCYNKVNNDFLHLIYGNAIADTAQQALRSKIDATTKYDILMEILEHPHTKDIMKFVDLRSKEAIYLVKVYGQGVFSLWDSELDELSKKKLLWNWTKVLYSGYGLEDRDYLALLSNSDIAVQLVQGKTKQVYEMLFDPTNGFGDDFANSKWQFLLHEAKEVRELAERLLLLGTSEDLYQRALPQILMLAAQNRLLQGGAEEQYIRIPQIILEVCASKYEDALNSCLERLQKGTFDETELVLQIAIRLAALLELGDIYVMLKKYECSILLERQLLVEAERVLSDLKEMCPEDKDVEELDLAIHKK